MSSAEGLSRWLEPVGAGFGRSPASPFCLWIAIGLGLMQLHWSLLYSPIVAGTWIVLGGSFVLFAFISRGTRVPPPTKRTPGVEVATLAAIGGYFAIAVVVNGGVPLFQILQGAHYGVYSFGIKNIHVLMLSFSGYYGIRAFAVYLQDRSWKSLAAFMFVLAILVVIANRSAVSFLVFGAGFLFLRTRRLRPLVAVVIGFACVGFLLLFGKFGDARLSQQITQSTGQTGSSTAIASVANASPQFLATGLPATWLWPYVYMSSPVANLNSAMSQNGSSLCGVTCSPEGLIVYQMVPDNVGKRIGHAAGINEFDKGVFLIRPDVTASTTYGSAVGYAGLIGAGAVTALLAIITLSVARMARGSEVQEVALAILATVLFFSFFENMVAYSAMSLQLVWVALRKHSGARYL